MTDQDINRMQAANEELQSINRLIERISQVNETNHIMSLIIGELVRLTAAEEGVINLVSATTEESLKTIVRKEQSEPDRIPFKVAR